MMKVLPKKRYPSLWPSLYGGMSRLTPRHPLDLAAYSGSTSLDTIGRVAVFPLMCATPLTHAVEATSTATKITSSALFRQKGPLRELNP
jgi:hypothetical protein